MIYLILWVYGQPYSGKSTFAKSFPNHWFLSLDQNAPYLTDRYTIARNMQEVSEAFKEIEQKDDVEWLIVDTIDILSDFVRYYYLDKYDIEDESDNEEYGKVWRLIREGFFKMISTISRFKGNVIFISHEEEFVVKNKIGVETTYYRPSINAKWQKRVTGLTTVILRTVKDSKKLGKEVITKYEISMGSIPEELSGSRIPIKNDLIENSYTAFMESVELQN